MGYDNNNRMVNFLREIYIEFDDNELITFISENCTNLLGYSMHEYFTMTSMQNKYLIVKYVTFSSPI